MTYQNALADTTKQPIVLSYGMGVDSTAILLRWLTDPTSRDFDLADLVVVTSQTGDEFEQSGALVEEHVLPLMREHGVRFVEIARKSQSQKGGRYVVIQDTRSPEHLNLRGRFRLSEEMLVSGTVPQSGGGHLCSIKSKAVPIEAWLVDEFGTTERRHAMGYSAEEGKRIRKDIVARASNGTLADETADAFRLVFGFSADEEGRIEKAERIRAEKGQTVAEFPLATWDWDRARCVEFIREMTGADWVKSACTFCPFSCGKSDVVDRYREHPEETTLGLVMEATAIAFNPRAGKLFKTKSLLDVLTRDENQAALDLFEAAIADTTWALYRVRRKLNATKNPAKFQTARSIEIVDTGSREDIADALEAAALLRGLKVEAEHAISRVVVQPLGEKFHGAQEEILVAAPATAENKAPRFDEALWIPNE